MGFSLDCLSTSIKPLETQVPSTSLVCHHHVGFTPSLAQNGCCGSRHYIQIHRLSLIGIVSHDYSPTNDWWFLLSQRAKLERGEEGQ